MPDVRSAVHIPEEDLELYIRGRLESERISQVEQHLLKCNICQVCLAVCLGQQVAVHFVQETKPESTQSGPNRASTPKAKRRSRHSIRYPWNGTRLRL
jgi:anti-sigma factor RsiW